MIYTRILEMPQMKYVVPGTPVPLQRPRYGMGTRPFDAQKRQKLEFKNCVEAQHGNLPFYTYPIQLIAFFHFIIPKTSITRTDELMNTPHVFRPDVSNLIKFVEDSVEGILYRDDSIVYSAFGLKFWSDVPRTEFIIIPVEPYAKVYPHAHHQI